MADERIRSSRSRGRASLPAGTVTFMFTDIEGSTSLLRRLREDYARLLVDHSRLLAAVVDRHGGRVVDTQGDALFAVFPRAREAVAAAAEAQRGLAAHPWPGGVEVLVRMGLHTGEPLVDGERYVGLAVHRGQRICSLAHGGQVLLSSVTADLIGDEVPAGVAVSDAGSARLKDFDREERLYQLMIDGLPGEFQRLPASAAPGPFSGSEDVLAARVSSPSPPVDVRLLGPVEVEVEGSTVPIGAAKQRLILALLALRAGEMLSSDVLVDLIWGGRPPATATKALQVYISELRHRIEPDRSAPIVIVSQPPGYRFGLDADKTDLGRFEDLWERGRNAAAGDDAEQAARLLGEALGLWRGRPLADLAYESAILSDAARLEEMRLACLEDRIEADLRRGRHAALVPEIEALVRENPLRERLRGQQMLALYRCGRQADALAAYQQAREALVEQLGIDPSPAIVKLERLMLQQDRSLELGAESAGASPAEPLSEERMVMVVSQSSDDVDGLLRVAAPLTRCGFSIVLGRVLGYSRGVDVTARLGEVTRRLVEQRELLVNQGISARVAAFASHDRGPDLVKLAVQQGAELILVDGTVALREGGSSVFHEIVDDAPCDVAMLVADETVGHGDAIIVPFGGSQHDWAALELAALLSRAQQKRLVLAGAEGTTTDDPDASRMLASASLILQRVSGIVAEPMLIERGAQGLLELAASAHLILVGIPPSYRHQGLGETRYQIAMHAPVPALFVRRGTRPGVLSPNRTMTRFSWSLSTWND
jgi:DNA-binding SARP family transcriptional activator/class 3 adenylate cyclase